MLFINKALGIGALVLALSGCSDSSDSRKPELNRPVYSSYGMDIVMNGKSSREVLSDWQVERAREWNSRNNEFMRCDRNKDGMLTGEEETEYRSLPIFNYRFR
ncbi:MAG: hypothetical protein Q7J54_06555 [Candidatus Woesearchaeota archaeon]|nr:hypothetical protein [Candidatus Woesearchaeota archaeon]